MTIYLASHNPKKQAELEQILTAYGVASRPAVLRKLPAEGTRSYRENAVTKARTASRENPGRLVLADDSGLSLAAAPGALGVQTARELAARPQGVGELDQLLLMVAGCDRHFTMTTVVALARDGELIATGTGTMTGSLAVAPVAGSGGLARLLVPEGESQPLVKLTGTSWLRQNPRARAIKSLLNRIRRDGLGGDY